MNIQWYPGHMTKAKRSMLEDIKLIDLVIEILDARCPISSSNPDIDKLAQNKLRLIILNKADLADDSVTDMWRSHFENKGYYVTTIDSRKTSAVKSVSAVINQVCADKIERDRKRGIKNRPVRAMVAGIPNVGKSTFINTYGGKAVAKTGNKPGVTKGKQWIRLNKSVELLDTPGILWPKFEDNTVGLHLAFIGSINDAIIDQNELACELVKFLKENYTGAVNSRYGVDENIEEYKVIEAIAVARNLLLPGAQPDVDKACRVLVDEFRSGTLGKITLEKPM